MEAEEEEVNLEWSLPVPSMQELVRQRQPDALPPRYVRDEMAPADHRPESAQGLPCIDLGKLMDPSSRSTELHDLHSACHQWGLFLVGFYLIISFITYCYDTRSFYCIISLKLKDLDADAI